MTDKHCQAMNRVTTFGECLEIQKDLPPKFCKGCMWFDNRMQKPPDPRGRKKGPGLLYGLAVHLPWKDRKRFTQLAKERGMRANVLLLEIVTEFLERNTRRQSDDPLGTKETRLQEGRAF